MIVLYARRNGIGLRSVGLGLLNPSTAGIDLRTCVNMLVAQLSTQGVVNDPHGRFI